MERLLYRHWVTSNIGAYQVRRRGGDQLLSKLTLKLLFPSGLQFRSPAQVTPTILTSHTVLSSSLVYETKGWSLRSTTPPFPGIGWCCQRVETI